MGRLINEDELIKGRVENDPVVIATKCASTAYDPEKIIKQLKIISDKLHCERTTKVVNEDFYEGLICAYDDAIDIINGKQTRIG